MGSPACPTCKGTRRVLLTRNRLSTVTGEITSVAAGWTECECVVNERLASMAKELATPPAPADDAGGGDDADAIKAIDVPGYVEDYMEQYRDVCRRDPDRGGGHRARGKALDALRDAVRRAMWESERNATPADDAGAAERAGVYVSRGDAEWAARLLSCLPFGATVTGRMADDAVTLAARISAALRGTKGA